MSTLSLITVSLNKGNICATSACSELRSGAGSDPLPGNAARRGQPAAGTPFLSPRVFLPAFQRMQSSPGAGLWEQGRKAQPLPGCTNPLIHFRPGFRPGKKLLALRSGAPRGRWQLGAPRADLHFQGGKTSLRSFLPSQMSPEPAAPTGAAGAPCKLPGSGAAEPKPGALLPARPSPHRPGRAPQAALRSLYPCTPHPGPCMPGTSNGCACFLYTA